MANQAVDSFVRVSQEISLPKIEPSIPQSKVHGRLIETRVVGVTFEGRQEVISKLHENDLLWLEREPENRFDANAVRVVRNCGEQVGYLNKYLAQNIAPFMDMIGYPLRAKVLYLTGSSFGGFSLGVVIRFKIPSRNQMRKARKFMFSMDWDD